MPVVKCAKAPSTNHRLCTPRDSGPEVSKNESFKSSRLFALDSRPKSDTSSTHIPAGLPPAFAAWLATASTVPDRPSELHRVIPGAGDGSWLTSVGLSGRVTSMMLRHRSGASCAR
jgi:hypothetical protein